MRANELTFLFDVDNTLLNNDRVQADLSSQIVTCMHGYQARDRYFAIFEQLRADWVTRIISALWRNTGWRICTI